MSGHNKWSKIKHKKAATDAKKSKIFSMLARQITIESKMAGGDTNSPSLRAIMDKAKKENMPKDNIERAVAKGAGAGAESYEPVLFEAFGPGGTALIIQGITDNTNRTSSEVKHIFSKAGYSLGAPGSAAWAFTKGEENGNIVWTPNQTVDLNDSDLESLEKLVNTLDEHDDVQDVFTNAS